MRWTNTIPRKTPTMAETGLVVQTCHNCAVRYVTEEQLAAALSTKEAECRELRATVTELRQIIWAIEEHDDGPQSLLSPDEQATTEIMRSHAHIKALQEQVRVMRDALKLYEEARLPGNYQFCGHHPFHDDLRPVCDCTSVRGCERVAALSNAPASSARKTGVELHCDDCQSPYAVWFAPNPIWNLVMGGPDAKGDPGGMLCPRCFTLRAEAAGVKPTAWEVKPEAADDCPLCPPLPGKN